MAISIIIPAHKEDLKPILTAISQYSGEYEVIIADTGFSWGYADFINVTTLQAKPSRGVQQNLAAKQAKYENLFFLHADSQINVGTLSEIENCLTQKNIGCLKLKFNDNNFILKICTFLSNLRVKYRNIVFGDQGLFIKKSLFWQLGGFDEIPIMEDYAFSLKLKRQQIKVTQLNAYIISSARKFKREGIIKTIIKMQILQYKFLHGMDPNEIVKKYYR